MLPAGEKPVMPLISAAQRPSFPAAAEEDTIKSRVFIIAIMAVALTTAMPASRASADPLTVLAVIGVLTVLSVSSADMIARSDEDTKDMRARQEQAARLHASAEASAEADGAAAAH
jgi:hypothetical protein